MVRVALVTLAMIIMASVTGCASVQRIGKLSEKPILLITVGTTVEIRWPVVEFHKPN